MQFAMFALTDSGKEITTFQDKMHIIVTAAVVLLSIASLLVLIISGFRKTVSEVLDSGRVSHLR